MDQATVIRLRGRAKAAFTRLQNSITSDLSKNEAVLHLERLERIYSDFDKFDAQLPEEQSEIEDFDSKYFSLKLQYQNLLDVLNVANVPNVPENSNISNFKLPKLNIPIFSGNLNDWMNFKDLFVATVRNTSLSNIQKFQYLIGSLADEPASIIKHIPLSNNSYEEAWAKLLARYDKKKQIVQSLIKTFLDQKCISQVDNVNLRQLADTSDEVIRGLKALGDKATSRDPWLIFMLLQKVDAETRKLWAQKTAEEDFPTLESFFEFLNLRCCSLEIIINKEAEAKVVHKNSNILRDALDSIYDARVPHTWQKVSWDSSSLGFWFTELLERNTQFSNWIFKGRPSSFWMTGFFNPQGFLTAMRQEVSRAHKGWALDVVTLCNDVTQLTRESTKDAPKEGVYVYGLYLEGASWDKKNSILVEPQPKVLFTALPVVHVYATDSTDPKDPTLYQCPVYKKPRRTDLTYITPLWLKTVLNPNHWILRGVALLCDIK